MAYIVYRSPMAVILGSSAHLYILRVLIADQFVFTHTEVVIRFSMTEAAAMARSLELSWRKRN